jgi:hypothetical protein
MIVAGTRREPLGAIALARSGDKGAHANVGVWVHTEAAYAFLVEHLTVDLVASWFAGLAPWRVERFELANLHALNFLLEGVLGAGGGASSLRTDAQAKAYGQALLRLELDIPVMLLDEATRPPFERSPR